jgi:YggT family protein
MALGEALDLTITVYVFVLILLAVMSLVATGYSPLGALLHRISEPLLAPLRPLLPPLGGIDFTPLVAIIGLQLLRILLVAPVLDLGRSLL